MIPSAGTDRLEPLLAGLAAQLFLLCFTVSDAAARSIVIVQSLTVASVLPLIVYLGPGLGRVHLGVGRLLFAPLVALSLWVAGASYGWRKYSQISFILVLVQIATGLFDVGTSIQAKWMYACAFLFVLLALGFVLAWAESLNK